MAWITAGRSIVFSRCNSALRRCAPVTVIGTLLIVPLRKNGPDTSGAENFRLAASRWGRLCRWRGSSVQALVQRLHGIRDQLAHALHAERGGPRAVQRCI